MSKKRLPVDAIQNELEGASLFFSKSPTSPSSPVAPPENKPELNQATPASEPAAPIVSKPTVILAKPSDNLDISPKPLQANKPASKQASMLSQQTYDPVETIRKTVKQLGKEVLFVRVTPEEKHELGAIVYSFNEIYRGEGRKTSENEVGRIALSFLMQDYRENGNNSILARVLAALNA